MNNLRSFDQGASLDALPGFDRTEPQYFKDPMIDRLIDVLLMMGGEMWSLRERQLVTEHLLETNGTVTRADIETFTPDAELRRQIDARRIAFVRQVFSGLYGEPTTGSSDGDHFAWLKRDNS